MLSAKQGSCEYHFLVFWYDSTWEINPVYHLRSGCSWSFSLSLSFLLADSTLLHPQHSNTRSCSGSLSGLYYSMHFSKSSSSSLWFCLNSTMSSANSISHVTSFQMSSVSLSMMIAKRNRVLNVGEGQHLPWIPQSTLLHFSQLLSPRHTYPYVSANFNEHIKTKNTL